MHVHQQRATRDDLKQPGLGPLAGAAPPSVAPHAKSLTLTTEEARKHGASHEPAGGHRGSLGHRSCRALREHTRAMLRLEHDKSVEDLGIALLDHRGQCKEHARPTVPALPGGRVEGVQAPL